MHIRLALPAAVLAALFALLAVACGGDDTPEVVEPDDPRNDFAARVLQLGEPLETTIDTRDGELVPGLQALLNPEAMTSIGIAVGAGDERLTLIAETAGTTATEFAAAWDDDPAVAFARFASGLRNAEDPQAVRDDLFLSDIASLPVHPDAVLVASGRIDNPDGQQRYFIVFDLIGSSTEIEQTVAEQLDQSPWQVTGGQSSEEIAIVQFQSTMSADVQGVAWVQPILSSATLEAAAAEAAEAEAGEDGEAAADPTPTIEGPLTSLLYLVQALPTATAEEEDDFELPTARPLPHEFPAAFLIDEDMTVIGTAWNRQPGGTAYQVTVLVTGSSFDFAESYRERFEAEGWELTTDDAVGFATLLGFASENDGIQGQVQLDAFARDEGYTEIVISLQVSSRTSNQ